MKHKIIKRRNNAKTYRAVRMRINLNRKESTIICSKLWFDQVYELKPEQNQINNETEKKNQITLKWWEN